MSPQHLVYSFQPPCPPRHTNLMLVLIKKHIEHLFRNWNIVVLCVSYAQFIFNGIFQSIFFRILLDLNLHLHHSVSFLFAVVIQYLMNNYWFNVAKWRFLHIPRSFDRIEYVRYLVRCLSISYAYRWHCDSWNVSISELKWSLYSMCLCIFIMTIIMGISFNTSLQLRAYSMAAE